MTTYWFPSIYVVAIMSLIETFSEFQVNQVNHFKVVEKVRFNFVLIVLLYL